MRRVNVDRMRRHQRRGRPECPACVDLTFALLHEPYGLRTVVEMVRREHADTH